MPAVGGAGPTQSDPHWLTNVSHEVGQSVALLGGAIEQLRETRTDPDVLELLDAVAGRLRALTDELLAQSRQREQG